MALPSPLLEMMSFFKRDRGRQAAGQGCSSMQLGICTCSVSAVAIDREADSKGEPINELLPSAEVNTTCQGLAGNLWDQCMFALFANRDTEGRKFNMCSTGDA